jgi:hypothetical protein
VLPDAHQIGVGDHADHASVVGHREVVHAGREHLEQGVAGQRVAPHRTGGERSDLGDRPVERATLRDHLRSQISIGHDGPRVAHRDQQARDPLVGHPLGRLRNGGHGLDRDRLATHQIADPPERGIPGLGPCVLYRRTDAPAHRREHEREPFRRAQQVRGVLFGDQVAKGVLMGADRERRRLVREQRELPEDLSFAEHVEDVVVRHELDRPLSDHVQRRRRGAATSQDHLAGREMRDLDDARELVQPPRGQLREWWVTAEERRDVHRWSIARANRLGV